MATQQAPQPAAQHEAPSQHPAPPPAVPPAAQPVPVLPEDAHPLAHVGGPSNTATGVVPNPATAKHTNGTGKAGVTPRAGAPTTAYVQVCSNCGYAVFVPNPNITAAKALGRATSQIALTVQSGSCPHCNNGAMVPATVTLP